MFQITGDSINWLNLDISNSEKIDCLKKAINLRKAVRHGMPQIILQAYFADVMALDKAIQALRKERRFLEGVYRCGG